MSVILSIEDEVINGNESFDFFELTGAYNVTTNPGGWGAPNEIIADALTAIIVVYLPGATVGTTINLFPSSFPTVNTAQSYNVTPVALGLGADDVLPDGAYTVQYIVTGDGAGAAPAWTHNTTETFVIVTAAQCCVDKMFLALDPCGCSCDDDAVMKALWAQALLEQAKAAACCGQIDNFNTLLAQVNKVCSGQCSGC